MIARRGPPRLIVSDNGPDLGHARQLPAAWRNDYYHVRLHSAHRGLPPAAAGERAPQPDQLHRSPAPLAAYDRP